MGDSYYSLFSETIQDTYMEGKSYIYKVTNLVNGKVYIGQSVNPIKRISSHIKTNGRRNYLLHYAIQKYGVENFLFEIIKSEIPIEQINETEIQCIKEHDCKTPNGYNLTEGGEGLKGYKWSDETRKKMMNIVVSEESKEKNRLAHLGKKASDETKKKMSAAQKGKCIGYKHSEDTRKNMSLAKIGKVMSEETKHLLREKNLGKKLSETHKEKMREAAKNKPPMSEETKKKMSDTRKGKQFTEMHKLNIRKSLKGKKLSDETKRKMSESAKKRKKQSTILQGV